MNIPLLSVCCLTYNHESFITDCLEGILMQKTTFPFEIVIHDDASTDNTQKIISDYISNNPDLFVPIFQIENQYSKGRNPGVEFMLPKARGKYIALIEGDDYWTDPYKLQKQVDFLEENEEYVLTFHPVLILHPDGQLRDDHITKVPENYESIEMLALYGNFIHTPSVVYRNVLNSFPESIHQTPIGDYFLYMLLAQYGKLKKLDDNMAVYRFGVGIHSPLSTYERDKKWKTTLLLLYNEINNIIIKEILYFKIYGNNLIVRPKWLSPKLSLENLNEPNELIKVITLKKLIKSISLKLIEKLKKYL